MRIHNPAITGSLTVSGSTTFSAGTVAFTGANQKISGSSTSTGSFGSVVAGGVGYNTFVGEVGIGTTSPESELHIKAATPEITIQRTDNNNDGVIDFQGSAGYVGAKIAHSGTDNNLVFHTYTGSTLKERLTITGGSAGTKISGSAISTGSFGTLETSGVINASGRIYEAGSSVIDHATAMAIVFGG